jgi:hypothetical protein
MAGKLINLRLGRLIQAAGERQVVTRLRRDLSRRVVERVFALPVEERATAFQQIFYEEVDRILEDVQRQVLDELDANAVDD